MKKFFIPIILLLCLSLTACGNVSQQDGSLGEQAGDGSGSSFFDKLFGQFGGDFSNSSKEPEIDIFSEPQIVLDQTTVELEELRDDEENHIGYIRTTEGTNCGVYGYMLFEILDLDKNVLFSYTPTFAGQDLKIYMPPQYISITETDSWGEYNPNINCNNYIFIYNGTGNPVVYQEVRNGEVTRFDLYGKNGELVNSITPIDPKNDLDFENCHDFDYSEGYYFTVSEYVRGEDLKRACSSRIMYYDSDWNLLCEIEYDYTENNDKTGLVHTRAKVKNASGKVLQTYERAGLDALLKLESGEHCGYDFTIYYNPESDCLWVRNSNGYDDVYYSNYVNYECIDLSENKVLFKLDKTYQDGNEFITEYSYSGGKLIATAPVKGSRYKQVKIYDKKGNLIETVEASNGEVLEIFWIEYSNFGYISFYDTEGNNISNDRTVCFG